MLQLGFNLQRTGPTSTPPTDESPIAGKGIVFTGKMVHGSRETMQAQALTLGARVQTAVSGETNYLVCGENSGGAKLKRARALGVVILNERQYLDLLARASKRSNDEG
jgi:DNA ligase (NAD+)